MATQHLVRLPAVAGTFYPGDPVTLAKVIDGYLAEATRLEPEPSILIAPHAGYVYSGGVAAHSFKQARRAATTRDHPVLIMRRPMALRACLDRRRVAHAVGRCG